MVGMLTRNETDVALAPLTYTELRKGRYLNDFCIEYGHVTVTSGEGVKIWTFVNII